MKLHAVAITFLLSAAGLAHADYRLVPSDASPLSKLCVAAAASKSDLQTAAAAADIKLHELDTVRCNGATLEAFLSKYRQRETVQPVAENYVFNSADATPETRLCLAAVTSDTEYRKVKNELFAGVIGIENEVRCNGIPLKRFAFKYASAGLSLSQR